LSEFHKGRGECKVCRKIKGQAYYAENSKKIKSRVKEYASIPNNKKRKRERGRVWEREYSKRPEVRERINAKDRKAYAENPQVRLRRRVKNALKDAMDGAERMLITKDIIGCSMKELKEHLESLFQPGMSWDNHGKWHIDHIIPKSLFDHTDETQLKLCWNYTNLQPLWAPDNLRKGAKLLY